MSPRYLLLVGAVAACRSAMMESLCERTGLRIAFASERIVALTNPACDCHAIGKTGCVLGWLFAHNGQPALLDAQPEAGLPSTGGTVGQELRRSWGGYVAAFEDADCVRMLRDPSGAISCYFYFSGSGLLVCASDADLLVDSGLSPEVDAEAVGSQFYRAAVPQSPTALHGVRELLAGFALRFAGRPEIQSLHWSPWDHVACNAETLDSGLPLRRTIEHCVRAWASTRNRLLLSVSGGLDSSILAACLARIGVPASCLTMYSDDSVGDERPFARALCRHLGLGLIERPYRLGDIDLDEVLAPHLPRPRDRTQANAYERVHLEVAEEIGADAFMTGNGGDSVFGYSQSAAPVADLYLTAGISREMVASLLDVCRQTGCSVSDALGQAWRLAHRPPNHPIRANPLFLSRDFVSTLKDCELQHPWLEAPPGALPGKALHIASLLRVQPTLEASRGQHLPVFSALMSQPIVESCLAIPSWEWRRGGRDRSLARRAFAADLPSAVLDRRVKGSPSGFAARLLDHFRTPIRERVLTGRLAALGIVDSDALENVLAGERPVGHAERVRILEIVNAEAWIAHWSGRSRCGASNPPGLGDGRGSGRVAGPNP